MAYNRNFDMGAFFENISRAAQDFERNFREGGFYDGADRTRQADDALYTKDGRNGNEYAAFSYPQANIYKTTGAGGGTPGALVFEFALAGFDEQDIDLSFQGDNMVLSARKQQGVSNAADGEIPAYLRRDITFQPVENRKFSVPSEEYAQEQVKAVFKNGLLTVTIPPKQAAEPKNKVSINTD
ncbi:MAG: Hsp20/alpha crystallin family protein [Spirochaetaceae bacterium]|jgi:HSP20 family molecular chaperone IbpA|nr:Hsp20/alpha crystallin family protein [Spirochaetaceae bacterium]